MNDQIKKILSYPYFRQAIEIAPEIYTPGQVQNYLWSHFGLPEGITNLSFLDVGANDGLFSFEAEKRGAKSIVASDLYKDGIDTMKNGWSRIGIDLLRQHLNSNVIIHDKGVYHLNDLHSKFDIVWVNHIINWLDNIELAIEQLSMATSGTLYISDGFILDNEKPVQIVPKNMPMRYMYNIKYISELLVKNGFSIDSVYEVNNQIVFIDKFLKFPNVKWNKETKVYAYPELNAEFKYSNAHTEISNGQIKDFYHINELGWVHKNDVQVQYFKPSVFYSMFKSIGLKSVYFDYLSRKHKKENAYSAFVIKASKKN
jgi:SAM-dependent methyltransferase